MNFQAIAKTGWRRYKSVRMAIEWDNRIGKRFLFAGVGYGGSRFPKDMRALKTSAQQVGINL